jgi:hypothetical protein
VVVLEFEIGDIDAKYQRIKALGVAFRHPQPSRGATA